MFVSITGSKKSRVVILELVDHRNYPHGDKLTESETSELVSTMQMRSVQRILSVTPKVRQPSVIVLHVNVAQLRLL